MHGGVLNLNMSGLRRLLPVVLGFILIPLWPSLPTAAADAAPQSFHDLGYGDQSARGMYGSLDYFFPVPAGQVPGAGSQIDLLFSHSPLLAPDRSTLTARVNGQSVASAFLTKDNVDHGQLRVVLPTDG